MSERTAIETMINKARTAMEEIKDYSQEQTDTMVYAVAKNIMDNMQELAELSFEDTKMGSVEEHKGMSEAFITLQWDHVSDKKSVGEIERDEEAGIIKVAHPGGVIANVIPVTTPVIGAVNNTINILKGRNAVINAPAPATKRTSDRVNELMREALSRVGAPEDLVQSIAEPSLEASQELMAKADIVIGTGGPSIVKAAYASGTPAYGVGAGNAQLILDETDDLEQFVEDTITSRLVNYAAACNGTQTLHYKAEDEQALKDAFVAQGAFWIEEEELIDKVRQAVFNDKGQVNRDVSGQPLSVLVEKALIEVPEGTKILITKNLGTGKDELLAHEKPVPVLNARAYETFKEAVDASAANLAVAGEGHSSSLYTKDEDKIEEASKKIKVSRLLVNQPTYHSTAGANNTMPPTVSQGNGYWGGNISNDLLEYKHLLNIQRIVLPRKRKSIPEDIWAKEI